MWSSAPTGGNGQQVAGTGCRPRERADVVIGPYDGTERADVVIGPYGGIGCAAAA